MTFVGQSGCAIHQVDKVHTNELLVLDQYLKVVNGVFHVHILRYGRLAGGSNKGLHCMSYNLVTQKLCNKGHMKGRKTRKK